MERQLLKHPACWNAEQLRTNEAWLWRFDDQQVDELKRLIQEGYTQGWASIEQQPALDLSMPALSQLTRTLRESLEHGPGAVLLRGFPLSVDSSSPGSHDDEVTPVAHACWRLLSSLGTPVPQTVDGQRLFRVQDEGLPDHHPQARGPSSRKRLSFHTDRCDVIAFLCIRSAAEGGDNQLVSSMAVYNRILATRPDLLARLCQPVAYRRHNVDPGNEHAFYWQPVFSFCQGHFACAYLRVLIDRAYAAPEIGPLPGELGEALDYLEHVANDPELCLEFRQEPGDIVLLNNFVTLHRRTGFVDDPKHKRLLLRLWLAVPNSRPLDPSFRASYGATEPGAIRGGMRPRGV